MFPTTTTPKVCWCRNTDALTLGASFYYGDSKEMWCAQMDSNMRKFTL